MTDDMVSSPFKAKKRCDWCGTDPLYVAYHDQEWGRPVYDDQKLFEFLILEGAQAGLSWITVLRKRENYRRLFDDFNAEKIARYNEHKVAQLLQDPSIIRNRLKINSAISNAQAFLKIQEHRSFTEYLWQFVNDKPIINRWKTHSELPSRSQESDTMSKDLKAKGFRFVGTTICYAHMQATGMVNDHLASCDFKD